MIVSHKYGFIFIKTGKVGGTSLEIALSRFLGPDDIITPVSPGDELERAHLGFRTCQNYEKAAGERRIGDWPKWFRGRLVRRFASGDRRTLACRRLPAKYWNHMDAGKIRKRVGDSVWNRYYKFTIERNPWDKVVSHYFWAPGKRGDTVSFKEFVRSGEPLKSHFDRYSINGIVAVDEVIRYDRMGQDLSRLSARLGLPGDLGEAMGSVSAKSGYRPSRQVEGFYDDWTRDVVEIFFAREIRLLGFEFGDWNAAGA